MPSAASGTARPDGAHDEHWTGRHAKPIIFAILSLVAIGVYLAGTIPVAVFPEVDFPRILVGVTTVSRRSIRCRA